MQLADITKLAGRHKRRLRVGRGTGSGHGKTCGRGHKGAGSRAGSKRNRVTEGGQMPIFRRLPKRGFSNAAFRTRYNVINIATLEERFDANTHVTQAVLADAGLIRHRKLGLKILGDGDLTKKFVIEADRFSKSAAEKIQSAGGEAKVLKRESQVS